MTGSAGQDAPLLRKPSRASQPTRPRRGPATRLQNRPSSAQPYPSTIPPPLSRCAASRSHLAFSLLSLPFHRQFDRDLSRCHLFVIFLCAREASCSICSTTDPSSPSIHASDPFPATPRALHPEAAFSGYGSEPWSRLRSGGGWPRRSPTLRPCLPSPQHHRPRPSLDHMPFRKTRCVD